MLLQSKQSLSTLNELWTSIYAIKINELVLLAYSYADWEGHVDDRRSTSGTTIFLGKCLVSCSRKKQSLISLSTK